MANFHDELEPILLRRGLTKASASAAIGMDRTYLGKILKSGGDLGMTPLVALADLVGMTVEQLVAGVDPLKIPHADVNSLDGQIRFTKKKVARRATLVQPKNEPRYEQFYSWFVNDEAEISKLGSMAEFVDIYRFAGVKQQRPILLSMGASSLASRALKKSRPAKPWPAFSMKLRKQQYLSVMAAHKRAVQFGVFSNDEQLLFPSGHEEIASLTYWRTLFRAKDGNDTLIVKYSKTICYEILPPGARRLVRDKTEF